MRRDAVQAYLALGSNLGDRLGYLRRAVNAIASVRGVRFDAAADTAPIYETTPIDGAKNDPSFLNTVIRLATVRQPHELFGEMTRIEETLGRTRLRRNEPRIIDIDLLLYGDLISNEPDLILPHPRMHERRFVLEPLKDLAPDLIHPVIGESMRALADRARNAYPEHSVKLFSDRRWYIQNSAGEPPRRSGENHLPYV